MGSTFISSIPDNLVQPFQLENNVARGRLVRLGSSLQDVLAGHQYPEPVALLLSDMLVLATLVSGIFKFNGTFSLQAKGDGSVGLIIVDLTSDGGLRGYAQFDVDAVSKLDETWRASPVPHLLGNGYLAFTVDQGQDTDRYQGIVKLAGATLADCAHNYFRESDQVDATVKLVSRQSASGVWRSGGLLIQKMPSEGLVLQSGDVVDEEYEDAWCRAVVLMSASREAELLDLKLHPHEFLFRLFHEDGVRVFDTLLVAQRCRCSADRVEIMLKSFPQEEIEELKVDGVVAVTCEFCGHDYSFEEEKLRRIFDEKMENGKHR
ncbi:MAG: Hsp33 family molecular chaperone HslO [Pseudomonadota bacterium]|nr:Hsp33 family molecular chaperone HslO [Pseudomonadota bacterium]